MKKTFFVLLSFALLMAFTTSAHSPKKIKQRTNNPVPPTDITYVVSVYTPAGMQYCGTYYVTIRDEYGFPIGAQIQYQAGVTNYIFHENGPVMGIRTAVLTNNLSPGSVCNQVLNTQPVSMQHFFRNGLTYMFDLYPVVQPANTAKVY